MKRNKFRVSYKLRNLYKRRTPEPPKIYWLDSFKGMAHGKHLISLPDLHAFLKKCDEAGLKVVGIKLRNPIQYLECLLLADDNYIHHFGKEKTESWYIRG